jgi:hypothetical protein
MSVSNEVRTSTIRIVLEKLRSCGLSNDVAALEKMAQEFEAREFATACSKENAAEAYTALIATGLAHLDKTARSHREQQLLQQRNAQLQEQREQQKRLQLEQQKLDQKRKREASRNALRGINNLAQKHGNGVQVQGQSQVQVRVPSVAAIGSGPPAAPVSLMAPPQGEEAQFRQEWDRLRIFVPTLQSKLKELTERLHRGGNDLSDDERKALAKAQRQLVVVVKTLSQCDPKVGLQFLRGVSAHVRALLQRSNESAVAAADSAAAAAAAKNGGNGKAQAAATTAATTATPVDERKARIDAMVGEIAEHGVSNGRKYIERVLDRFRVGLPKSSLVNNTDGASSTFGAKNSAQSIADDIASSLYLSEQAQDEQEQEQEQEEQEHRATRAKRQRT